MKNTRAKFLIWNVKNQIWDDLGEKKINSYITWRYSFQYFIITLTYKSFFRVQEEYFQHVFEAIQVKNRQKNSLIYDLNIQYLSMEFMFMKPWILGQLLRFGPEIVKADGKSSGLVLLYELGINQGNLDHLLNPQVSHSIKSGFILKVWICHTMLQLMLYVF